MLKQGNGPTLGATGDEERTKTGRRVGRVPKNRAIVKKNCKNSPGFAPDRSATWPHSLPRRDVPPAMMPTPARNIADSSADLSVGARKTGRLLAAEDRRRRVKAEATGKVSTEPLAAGEAEPANFGLWDSVPRYAVSRQQQQKWRGAGTFPALLEMPFQYRGRRLTAIIQPAAVKGTDGAIRSDYPGASEELIEGVLRKRSADQHSGYSMPREQRSGVVFTLHALRKEVERRGHGRTYAEIVLSLDILSSAVIEIATANAGDSHFLSKSTYLHSLTRVSKTRLAEDPGAKWYAGFHPFASRALDELTYRQINYARLMGRKLPC